MRTLALTAVLLTLAGSACGPADGPPETAPDAAAPAPTNRIDLDASVRANLGVTWARARRGRLERVRTLPAEIIPWPGHAWTLRASLGGILVSAAAPWTAVTAGQEIARIASPELAALQHDIGAAAGRAREAEIALRRLELRLEPLTRQAEVLETAARETRASLAARADALERTRTLAAAAETRAAEVARLRTENAVSEAVFLDARREALQLLTLVLDAEATLRDARLAAAERELAATEKRVEIETAAQRVAALRESLREAEADLASRLAALAAAEGTTVAALGAVEDGRPAWTRLDALVLRAPADGIITQRHVSPGTRVEADARLLEMLDPSVLGLRAHLPESDGARLSGDLELSLVLPGETEARPALDPVLRPEIEASTRSLLLEARLANPDGRLRPGGSASARLVIGRGALEEVLIPRACVVEDGLDRIVFRRDPGDPDRVIRTELVLGDEAAGWVEVIAGVGEDDELVLAGARQLREAGRGAAAAGGHFHADGTWHEGDH